MIYKRKKNKKYSAVCRVCGKQYGFDFIYAIEAFQYAKDTGCICENCEKIGYERKPLDAFITSAENKKQRFIKKQELNYEILRVFKETKSTAFTAEKLCILPVTVSQALNSLGYEWQGYTDRRWVHRNTGEVIQEISKYHLKTKKFYDGETHKYMRMEVYGDPNTLKETRLSEIIKYMEESGLTIKLEMTNTNGKVINIPTAVCYDENGEMILDDNIKG